MRCNRFFKRSVLAITAMTIVVISPSCAKPPGPSHQGGLSDSEAQAVYSRRAGELSLPEGASWPPLELRDGKYRIQYTEKQAISLAEGEWLCSWERRAVDSHVSKKVSRASVVELRKFHSMITYTDMYAPETRAYFDSLMQKAELGDLAPMADDVRTNCS